MDSNSHEKTPTATAWLALTLLVVAVFVAYSPVWRAKFVWDDDIHLVENPVLKPGGLAKAWVPGVLRTADSVPAPTSTSTQPELNYWPLTFTVYRLEYAMWGLNPTGYHLVNIALHAISAVLVWRILGLLKAPGALLAAAIFALHPVNVESVAWVAQLKTTLSLLLALVSTVFYLQYDERGGAWRYTLAVLAFLFSTLAKVAVITLPLVLLLCAWWRRGRIRRRDLLLVAPYLVIGLAMVALELDSQHGVARGVEVRSDGLLSRTAIAGLAVWFYFWKVVWPVNLCFVYPRWDMDPRNAMVYLPGALLVLLGALAWWRRTTWGRPLLMLIVGYVALLLPVLGFVNIYFMEYSLVADHWQYAATIIPCAVLTGVATSLFARFRLSKAVGGTLVFALLTILSGLTWQQSRTYADSETLYRATIARNPQAWLAQGNLANMLVAEGRYSDAIPHYEAVLHAHPRDILGRFQLAKALAHENRLPEAAVYFEETLSLNPGFAEGHYRLGVILYQLRRNPAAIEHLTEAARLGANDAATHLALGRALQAANRAPEAADQFEAALRLSGNNSEARNGLGAALAKQGRFREAVEQFRAALAIDPNNTAAQNNLRQAEILLRQGSP